MKWVTREKVRVGRIACSWLIKNFVDPEAEFLYVPREQVLQIAEQTGAIAFHVRGSKLAHTGVETSFEAILSAYDLASNDPALDLLGRIVNGADTNNARFNQPEGPGVRAVTEGLRSMNLGGDEEIVARGGLIFDALYAYCREQVAHKRTSVPERT